MHKPTARIQGNKNPGAGGGIAAEKRMLPGTNPSQREIRKTRRKKHRPLITAAITIPNGEKKNAVGLADSVF